MSHVKRKRPQHINQKKGKVARKKDNKRAWLSFFLILILFVSVLAAILFAIISVEGY